MDIQTDQHQDTTPETPIAAPAPVDAPEAVGPAYGSILGIILIVGVLVAGAFYVWGERINSEETYMPENGVRGDTLPLDGSIEGNLELETSSSQPQ